MIDTTATPSLPAVIQPGHRFLFTPPRGKDTEYVVAHAEKDMGPAGIVKLHRLDVTPERERDFAQVTEHWLRKRPPGYSGYWTFLGGPAAEQEAA